MNAKISKTNEKEAFDRAAFFNARLDEIRMNGYERLKAKAQLARAEAFADAVITMAGGIRRLLRTLVVRPYRRLTASLG